jgi:SAM-dependent methyltransferase
MKVGGRAEETLLSGKRRARSLLLALGMTTAIAAAAPQHGRLFPPEDLGLLEAPDRDAWQRPDQIMDALGIAEGKVVADLGAGGGWFSIRLGRRVRPNGIVYAEDVQPLMVRAIERRKDLEGLNNIIRPHLGTADDAKLPPGQLDAALFVDSYHEVERPVVLLRNVAKSLKPRRVVEGEEMPPGRIGIVDFTKDGGGPGPSMDERVDPERVIRDAEAAGLQLVSRETFLRYQYMLVFEARR